MTATYVHDLLNPKNWKPAKGYANGVAAEGRQIYLGGHIGWNGQPPTRFIESHLQLNTHSLFVEKRLPLFPSNNHDIPVIPLKQNSMP